MDKLQINLDSDSESTLGFQLVDANIENVSKNGDSLDELGSETSTENVDVLGVLSSSSNSNSLDGIPGTVSVIHLDNGSIVYLVGTAHYSEESQKDVAKTIQTVQPDIVMVELCPSRTHILHLDKDTLLEEARTISVSKIASICKSDGFYNGLMYLVLLQTSASITKQLNMAPGGEFRVAYQEALKIKCIFQLGDRPLKITIQRAMGAMTWWQAFTLTISLLFQQNSISMEDVESYKNKDLLEQMLLELSTSYPEMGRVFLQERDKYLAYSLQIASLPQKSTNSEYYPVKVVAVVGIGHVAGIRQLFGTVTNEEIEELIRIPKPAMSTLIVRAGIKLTIFAAVSFACYKVIPRSVSTATIGYSKSILSFFC